MCLLCELQSQATDVWLLIGGFYITLSDVPQSVGLLWTSGQLVAETST